MRVSVPVNRPGRKDDEYVAQALSVAQEAKRARTMKELSEKVAQLASVVASIAEEATT